LSSENRDTFLFSLIKRYVARYSEQPDAKTIFKFKQKLVPLAIDLYKREGCSYDDALELVLDDLELGLNLDIK
jgi:hypothetical protein